MPFSGLQRKEEFTLISGLRAYRHSFFDSNTFSMNFSKIRDLIYTTSATEGMTSSATEPEDKREFVQSTDWKKRDLNQSLKPDSKRKEQSSFVLKIFFFHQSKKGLLREKDDMNYDSEIFTTTKNLIWTSSLVFTLLNLSIEREVSLFFLCPGPFFFFQSKRDLTLKEKVSSDKDKRELKHFGQSKRDPTYERERKV